MREVGSYAWMVVNWLARSPKHGGEANLRGIQESEKVFLN
jgi:hypothetical protein